MTALRTAHGELAAPCFLPDATRAVVRGLDAADLESVGVRGLMVNGFHVSSHPGIRRVQHLGGLHRFMGWPGPIAVDSGGFQIFSLIRQNPDRGSIRERAVLFRAEDGRRVRWTPEKCIQHQFQLGADVMVALDDCTDASEDLDEQKRAVDRTVAWTRRAREEFERQLSQRRTDGPRPLLIGVIQGGAELALRTHCAQALCEIGVDGFGYGGWPVDERGALQYEIFEALSRLLPPGAPRFALGIGKPEHLVALCGLPGAYYFDCSLPTRDARHRRLYRFRAGAETALAAGAQPEGAEFYEHVHILDARHGSDPEPLDPSCDCPTCRRYGTGYLHHLFRIDDGAAGRLATLHNLRFYTRLVERLAAADTAASGAGPEPESPARASRVL